MGVQTSSPFSNTYSLEFDGVNDYLGLGSSTSLGFSNDFTLSAWIKTSAIGTNQMIIDSSTASNGSGYAMYLRSTGVIRFWSYLATNDINSTTTLLPNTWYHICATHDRIGLENKLYINGVLDVSGASGSFNPTPMTNLRIGASALFGFPFNGNIDEPCFFNRKLIQSEITTLATAPTVDLTNLNPIAWYRMGDNGAYKDPQWLIPNNENKDKVSNYSFEFDGIDDYINIGNGVNFEYTDSFSYSFWVKPNAVTGAKVLYTKYNSLVGGRGIYFYINSSGGANPNTLYFFLLNTNSGSTATRKRITTNTGAIISPSVWTNIVITYDGSGLGSGINVYKNGVSQTVTITQDNLQNNTILNSSDSYLGAFNGTSSFLAGNQDEFAIYSTELSSADALAIYNGGEPTTISGAVAHYKMGEEATFSTNWTIPDNVGTNTGTSANMTIEDRVGEAPNSTDNALSYNMESVDRTTDVPT